MVYMYHSFLIHSSADGHLGCFHVLAMINSAVMNVGVHVSISDLVSLVCMPRSGIAGSYGSSISRTNSFLKAEWGIQTLMKRFRSVGDVCWLSFCALCSLFGESPSARTFRHFPGTDPVSQKDLLSPLGEWRFSFWPSGSLVVKDPQMRVPAFNLPGVTESCF